MNNSNTTTDLTDLPNGSGLDHEKLGYKQTKLGWIPEDWEIVKLRLLISKLDAGVSVNCNDSDMAIQSNLKVVLKTSAISDDGLGLTNVKLPVDEEIHKLKTSVIKDRIIICRKNTPELVGRVALANKSYPNIFLPDLLWQSQPSKKEHSTTFLLNILKSSYSRYQIGVRSNGSSKSMVNISKNSFLGIQIPFPPLPEQKAIAQCLTTWDRGIATLRQLIAQKELQKKGLMQQLLTGKKRLPGFSGEWEENQLGVYFKERKETGFVDLPLLSVGEAGVYPQADSNKRDISNKDKSKYKRICKGDIGYNTMRMWQGRSALSQLEGIVSPAYTIVTPKENADVNFFAYLFKLPLVIHKFYRNSQGLVSDTWNCKYKDFALVKLDLPSSKEEQTAIAQVLQTADRELAVLGQKLEQFEAQKKGLMQQLLTGKKRLPLAKT